jgi:hypothetical protein
MSFELASAIGLLLSSTGSGGTKGKTFDAETPLPPRELGAGFFRLPEPTRCEEHSPMKLFEQRPGRDEKH